MKRLLGEILVEAGLSPERLKKALDHQKKRGERIGTLLMRLNFIKGRGRTEGAQRAVRITVFARAWRDRPRTCAQIADSLC